MGTDLSLIVLDVMADDIMDRMPIVLDRDYELQRIIRDDVPTLWPPVVDWNYLPTHGDIPTAFRRAGGIVAAATGMRIRAGWNVAVLCLLAALPADHPVGLLWD